MLCIGKYAIVMNNYYWDEYIRYYVNEDLKKKIIKFYLSSDESIFEKNDFIPAVLLEQWKKRIKEVNYPDTKISEVSFDKLNNELQNIINCLHDCIKYLNEIVFLPILSVRGEENAIYNYGINFADSKIVLYNVYLNDFMKKNNLSFIISYFQNIDESILLFGSEAYLKTILQVGFIKGSLENWLSKSFNINEITEPRQRWTHGLGINPYRELLISSTCIGTINDDV